MSWSNAGIVEVRVGEYLDISESVYRKDSDPTDETEIRKWLAERIEGAYGYGALERLDLAGGDYSEMDFRYSAFARALLAVAASQRAIWWVQSGKAAI